MYVHAVGHPSTDSRIEPSTNVLRGTGGVVGAALGGADAITMRPRDALIGGSPAGRRLALTAQAVLAEESHLAAVADPAAGSRHVEQLTDGLARAAWAWLQRIEQAGGLAAWAASGGLSEALSEARSRAATATATRRDAWVGVSRYARPEADDLGPTDDPAFRPAAAIEALRDRVVASGRPLRVQLVTLGPVAQHKGPAGFAADVYAMAGIPTTTNDGPADGVCLCGLDPEDPKPAVEALHAAADAPHRALAGRPGAHADALTAAGMTAVVHRGGDVVAFLSDALDAMGAV